MFQRLENTASPTERQLVPGAGGGGGVLGGGGEVALPSLSWSYLGTPILAPHPKSVFVFVFCDVKATVGVEVWLSILDRSSDL